MSIKSNATDFNLKAKAILAVRHGRELAELMSRTSSLPVGVLNGETLAKCIRRLKSGEVTDGRVLTVIEAMVQNIAAALPREVADERVEWHLRADENGEEFWIAVNVPIYTARGEGLCELSARMLRFIEVRQGFIDQANAERLERQHLR